MLHHGQNQHKGERIDAGSQFEGVVCLSRDVKAEKNLRRFGHTVSSMGQEAERDKGCCLVYFLLFNQPGP